MFSTYEYLDKKTGDTNLNRPEYLQKLIDEFQAIPDTDLNNKRQVLANLANFAYDPINFEYFRMLNIMELFVDVISDCDDEKLVEYAIAGICNCCLDPVCKGIFIRAGAVDMAIKCLSSTNEETVLSAMTTLMYLMCPNSSMDIVKSSIVDCMKRLSQSQNSRISNLAIVFLTDYAKVR